MILQMNNIKDAQINQPTIGSIIVKEKIIIIAHHSAADGLKIPDCLHQRSCDCVLYQ